jgi:hypothetical protein
MAGRISYYGGIVTNGLVLALDAAKKDSYPGSGTVWRDISGNGNNGTLTNGPTFNSNNGGSIVFDGVDDSIRITNNQLYRFENIQPFSFNFWYKCTSTSGIASVLSYALNDGRGYYFSIDLGVVRTNSFFFDYWDGNVYRGIQGNTNSLTRNEWVMVTCTSSTNSVNDMKVYQNAILTSFTNRGTGTPNTINYGGLSMDIGARGGSSYFKGNIAQTLIYNRALSATEVLQNYNATKSRFGL